MAGYAAEPASDEGGQQAVTGQAAVDPLVALATTWIAELDAAERDKDRTAWLDRSKAIVKLYRQDQDTVRSGTSTARKKFALFWSSVQTIAPAIYARTPQAVVTRRYKDNDPLGRLASEVLERSLNFSIDTNDFNGVMLGARDQFLLVAMGPAWVRYVPTLRTVDGQAQSVEVSDDPEPYEVVDWEEVKVDRVQYDDFLWSPARTWEEVRWIARRCFMTRAELKVRFPECGEHVPLSFSPDGKEDAPDDLKKAPVYEIWDRVSKQAIWVCKEYPAKALDARPDPLKLRDFFPCPRPLFGTQGPDSLVPTPDYLYWQDQAQEINKLTAKIDKCLDALRVRGFYNAANETDLNNLLKAEDNVLIPVESPAALADAGGLKGLIDWMPTDQIAATLKECFAARRQLIEDVFQITGISDIQRGAGDPDETATGVATKAQWGALRVRDRQKELARFARDIVRIMGEVIASRFDPKVLAAMTGVQLLTAQQKQEAIQQLQAAAQAQQGHPPGAPPPPPPPIPPGVLQQLNQPTWDDVAALLRDPALRAFRIDIETDSTIEPNDQEEKARRIEFVEAVGKYLADSLPVVQAQPAVLPIISQGLLFLVRGFRVGREMEDVIERAVDQLTQAAQQPQQPPQPDPVEMAKAQAATTNAQANMIKAQSGTQANQVEAARVQSDHQLGVGQIAAENMRTNATLEADMRQAVLKASERRLTREINSTTPMQAHTQ
jgi:hypothetical protein